MADQQFSFFNRQEPRQEAPADDRTKPKPTKLEELFGGIKFGLGNEAEAFFGEAERTRQVEEQRRTDTLGHLRDTREFAGQPTITPDVVQNLFGQSITQAGATATAQQRDFGARSASENTFGGGAPSAGRGVIETGRLDALAQQQSAIANLVAQDRGAARARQLQVDQLIAGVMGKDPAMQTADALGTLFQTQAQLTLGEMEIAEARRAAEAAEPEWWEIALGALPGVGRVLGGIL